MKKIALLLVTLQLVFISYASELAFQISGHTPQDIAQVEELNESIFGEKNSFKDYQNSKTGPYQEGENLLLLAKEQQSKVIGFCLFVQKEHNSLYVRWLGIAQLFQKKGIGRKLLLHLESMFTPSKITLVTTSDVIGFYEKIGFKVKEGEDRELILVDMEKVFSK